MLKSIFRRDGAAALFKCIRYGLSPMAWCWLFTNVANRRALRKSGLFDKEWYLREYPDVATRGVDPIQDYLTPPHPWIRLPNPDFIPSEYAAVNLDVKASDILPAVHYAKHDTREGRCVSTLEEETSRFPDGAVELTREFGVAPARHRRTAVFASFFGNGRIPEPVRHYLRGLKEVADNIVFVANCPVFPDELPKLEGLASVAVFRHHGCYDFGSYKIGWNEAKSRRLLNPKICDELIVCNDSCVGPVFPFCDSFDEIARRAGKIGSPIDFWGVALVRQYGGRIMIPSYFYVFGPAILEGGELGSWFDDMPPCRNRGQVILNCESRLTQHLVDCGYSCDGLVPESFVRKHGAAPTKCPLKTMMEYHVPLVKVKALKGDSFENPDEVMSFIEKANPALASVLPRYPRYGKWRGLERPRKARIEHGAGLAATATELRQMAENKRPIPVVLLSVSGEEQWLRPLFDALSGSDAFPATVAAIPDMRFLSKGECLAGLRAARRRLLSVFPEEAIRRAGTDQDGNWIDLTSAPCVVFYASASDWSDFHYNPHYSLGRKILPVLVFDRSSAAPYPLAKEFARQNYAFFWKVFFTDREAFDLYARHSLSKGENAVLANDLNAVADSIVSLASHND